MRVRFSDTSDYALSMLSPATCSAQLKPSALWDADDSIVRRSVWREALATVLAENDITFWPLNHAIGIERNVEAFGVSPAMLDGSFGGKGEDSPVPSDLMRAGLRVWSRRFR